MERSFRVYEYTQTQLDSRTLVNTIQWQHRISFTYSVLLSNGNMWLFCNNKENGQLYFPYKLIRVGSNIYDEITSHVTFPYFFPHFWLSAIIINRHSWNSIIVTNFFELNLFYYTNVRTKYIEWTKRSIVLTHIYIYLKHVLHIYYVSLLLALLLYSLSRFSFSLFTKGSFSYDVVSQSIHSYRVVILKVPTLKVRLDYLQHLNKPLPTKWNLLK